MSSCSEESRVKLPDCFRVRMFLLHESLGLKISNVINREMPLFLPLTGCLCFLVSCFVNRSEMPRGKTGSLMEISVPLLNVLLCSPATC